MAINIAGGVTGEKQEVEAGTLAARVTTRPIAVGAGGAFMAASASGIMAAGLGAAAPIFSFRGSATLISVIHRITFEMGVLGTAFTAGQSLFNLFVARSFTVNDTGGGALTMTTNNAKKRTSHATATASDIRTSATATLTAGTRTLDAAPIASVVVPVPATTVSTILVPNRELIRPQPDGWPLVLAANEGFAMQATVPATGTWCFNWCVEWDEVAAY